MADFNRLLGLPALVELDQIRWQRYICLSEYENQSTNPPSTSCSGPSRIAPGCASCICSTGGELCVCDIVAVLLVPQPKASRHLAYLRRAGLVTARKEGLWSYYQLAPARGTFHRKLLDCLACCFRKYRNLRRTPSNWPRGVACCG